ncbi:MAG: hypothetical protein MJ025_06685, partial [Victivallaceae bacterium]|nr:hypothetical protein [Victivallaceae bacterium]
IQDFIESARRKRDFTLPAETSPEKLLAHLNLLDDDGRLKNAAILLFGKKPQKYFITSEVKCMQFFGNKIERPLPSYQIYKGDVFELIDKATDFVMGRLNNWVGVRDKGRTASVETHLEIPTEVIKEAIVNAVCHRDYRSNASVQVMLFRNRVEIWNPGTLPYGLTIAKLYENHKSIPANPLLAEPMYYKGYIEKAGTGTWDMVDRCRKYGLRDPQFLQDEDFKVVIYRPSGDFNGQGPSQGPSQGLGRNILDMCREPKKITTLCETFGFSNRTKFRERYVVPLLRDGYIGMVIPEKPTSSKQMYRTTSKGVEFLEANA